MAESGLSPAEVLEKANNILCEGNDADMFVTVWIGIIDLKTGKKEKRVFIRDGKACLIYKGIKNRLPDSVTREQVSENMYHLYNYSLLIPNTYNYYKELGEDPIIDTWQR